MISHPDRCLFVHIPKTAGMSVEHFFLGRLGLSWAERAPLLLTRNDDPALGPPQLSHLTAAEYLRLGYLPRPQFDDYFKFGFVRNPWDRLVSEYRYRGYPVKVDFKTYLRKYLPAPGWTDLHRHVVPQYDFLHDESGRLLVDFVGRYERLQEDFDRVCERLGIPASPLPRINRSMEARWPDSVRELRRRLRRAVWSREKRHTFPHYTQYYDEESRALVDKMFERDIAAFNYSFGDPVPSDGSVRA